MIKLLQSIINNARISGLKKDDILNAEEFLKYNELGLCLDTIITQLHEDNIIISKDLYNLIDKAAKEMNIPLEDYSFLNDNITEDIQDGMIMK